MSKLSALLENGYKEGTKEFEMINVKLIELNGFFTRYSCGISRNMTENRLKKIHELLKEIDELNFDFDIGTREGLNSKTLLNFFDGLNLDNSNGVLIAQELFRKHFKGCVEFNPVSYGYGIKDIKELIN